MRDVIRRSPLWLLVVFAAGCVGPVEQTGSVYRHRDHGYSVRAPGTASEHGHENSDALAQRAGNAGDARWERVALDGASLVFRGPSDDWMMLKSRCGRPIATAQLMARHLLIGLPERNLVAAHPVEVAGQNGWLQVVDTVSAGQALRLKTVTLIARRCSFDLVLVAGASRFAEVEPVFDAWWRGFHFVTPDPGA